MENGVIKKSDTQAENPETLLSVQPNRIVVFGSRISGANILSTGLSKYLKEKGIQNPKVHYVRNITNIQPGFFDYWPQDENNDYYPDNWTNDEFTDNPTLPRGVILLPEMRQYHEMTGMFVPSYAVWLDIKKLCDKYEVPLVIIDKDFTPEQIETEIIKLLPYNLTSDNK